MKWYVEVVKRFDGIFQEEVVRKLKYDSQEEAEHAENGVNRNLNHDEYFTRIVSEE